MDLLCQWHYDYFIKPFMNSPDSFKFLVNIKYVEKEYMKGAHCVHPDTVVLCQEWLSQLATGCVTCHTCHSCVTHFRPILGNIVEVTLVTFPILYIVSHTKGTSFP